MTATTSTREQRLTATLQLIREKGGRWTTKRLHRIRRTQGGPAAWRGTARSDLVELHRRGHLDQHGPNDGRYYTPRKDNHS